MIIGGAGAGLWWAAPNSPDALGRRGILRLVRASRAELIAEVMLAMTDTSRDDFDVAGLLYTLTTACVELFDVDAAGMLLIDEHGRLVPVAATHDGSEHLERLQIMTREGPCVDAVRAVDTVGCDDLDDEADRWPQFVRQARAEGYRAVHAAPVALRADVVGGLNLFRTQPGPVPAADQVLLGPLASAAAVGILHHRAQRDVGTVNEQLKHALSSRIIIEQAKGVLAERHALHLAAAFTRLRSHARSHQQPLATIAQAVVEGTLDLQ
jgi:GAF domain-containing protein